jgi:uroporphyrinogen-III synthase
MAKILNYRFMGQFKILSTKHIKPHLKEEVAQKGIELVEQEFVDIVPILTRERHDEIMKWVLNPEDMAVVFTSRNAAVHVKMHMDVDDTCYVTNQWKIFCLDGATKEAVFEQLYVADITATANNAAELAQKIIEDGTFKKVIFFCGSQRRDELPELLTAKGIEVVEVVVYETVESPKIATNDLDVVLFFSPSGVKSFFSVNTLPEKTACFAIGPTTAKTLEEFTGNRIITSELPSQETMLANVWFYLQNINHYG